LSLARSGSIKDEAVLYKVRFFETRPEHPALSRDDFEALEKFCRGKCCTVPEMVRVVALRLARVL